MNVYEMKLLMRVMSAWLSEQSEFTDASFATAQQHFYVRVIAQALRRWRSLEASGRKGRQQRALASRRLFITTTRKIWRGWWELVSRRLKLKALGRQVESQLKSRDRMYLLQMWREKANGRKTIRKAFEIGVSFHSVALALGEKGMNQRLLRRVVTSWHDHIRQARVESEGRARGYAAVVLWKVTVGTRVFHGWLSYVKARRFTWQVATSHREASLRKWFTLVSGAYKRNIRSAAHARKARLLRGMKAFKVLRAGKQAHTTAAAALIQHSHHSLSLPPFPSRSHRDPHEDRATYSL